MNIEINGVTYYGNSEGNFVALDELHQTVITMKDVLTYNVLSFMQQNDPEGREWLNLWLDPLFKLGEPAQNLLEEWGDQKNHGLAFNDPDFDYSFDDMIQRINAISCMDS